MNDASAPVETLLAAMALGLGAYLGFRYVKRREAYARTKLMRWAAAQKYAVLHAEPHDGVVARMFRYRHRFGPVWFDVTVDGPNGIQHGVARCGTPFLGLLSNSVTVEWQA